MAAVCFQKPEIVISRTRIELRCLNLTCKKVTSLQVKSDVYYEYFVTRESTELRILIVTRYT